MTQATGTAAKVAAAANTGSAPASEAASMPDSLDEMSQETELALVSAARAGDHSAFTLLLKQHDRKVMRVILRFTANRYDREDLYQNIFTACYKALPRFSGNCRFYTWLYRIAMNQCISFMRRHRYFEPEQDIAVNDISRERCAKLKAINEAQSRLEGPQQISFHLFYIEGWSLEEIANVVECKVGSVKSHLHRARKKIRADHEVQKWNIEI
ncbi:MAG: sigma-70 family RNA polymerase sigma factor [Pseudohongiellaceae bacterium]